MSDKIKTCLWCAVQPCSLYDNIIRVKASEMLGEDASNFRQMTAWNCEQYVEENNVGTNETLIENSGKEGRTTN